MLTRNKIIGILTPLFLLLLQSGLISVAQADPDDIYWESGFEPPRAIVGTWMYSLGKYQGKVIIGGDIQAAGSTVARNIVAWDGTDFTSIGDGLPGSVFALAEYHGSLIAGGGGFDSGGVAAAWDGNSWTTLGSHGPGWVSSMVVWNDKLWVGGDFDSIGGVACGNVAMWDGSSWHPLGVGTSTAGKWVSDICIFQDKLIVAGKFDSAGGVPANNIAAWDGTSWSTLGDGVNKSIGSVIVFQSLLIAGGGFDSSGTIAAKRLASWDGSTWSPMGGGANKNIGVLDQFEGKLIASGDFDTIDAVAARRIAIYDGVEWKPIDTGLTQPAYAFLEDSGTLIICGRFSASPPLYEHSLATWDSTNGLKPVLGRGLDDPVLAISTYDNQAIVGGIFRMAGGKPAGKIAKWDGSQLSSIGTDVSFANNGGIYVQDFAEYDGKLIVAGYFDSAGGSPIRSLAAWDGNSWSSLGNNLPSGSVPRLALFDNKLIATGTFQVVEGSDTIKWFGAWDGSYWSSMGNFKWRNSVGLIYDLVTFNNQLIALGMFDSANGLAVRNIAAWDGNTWAPLGAGIGDQFGSGISACVFNNELVVGGDFTTAGGMNAAHIAKWDGNSWSPLGVGIVGPSHGERVMAMTIYDSKLIVGGTFETAGGVTVNNIAAWDGATWSALGSGISEPIELLLNGNPFGGARVNALAVFNDKLLVGGDFTGAGGKLSCGFAIWDKGTLTGAKNDRPSDLPDGYQVSQNYPNPFNPSTQINYDLPVKSQVRVTVYNLLGQQVKTLINEVQSAGSHTIVWDGRTDAGKKSATGMYMYRVEAGTFSQTKKMILLK